MRKLNLFLGAAVIAAGVAGVTSCDSGLKLTVWGPIEQKELYESLINDFKEANPDTKYNIKFAAVGEDKAYTQISTDVKAGADVYAFANDQILNLKRIGALAKIGGTYLTDIKANNIESSVNAAKIGEDVYAYPMSADNGYFLYYDASVISAEQAEKVDTILAACQAASTATQKKTFQYNMKEAWYTASMFFGAGCTFNTEYDEKGKEKTVTCDFDDAEKGVIAGTAMINLAKSEYFKEANQNVLVGTDAAKGETVVEGTGIGEDIAAGICGTWVADKIKAKLGDNYRATDLPSYTVNGVDYHMGSFAGFKLMGVNPASKNLAEAHKLAAFLTSESSQTKRFAQKSIGPSNTTVAASNAVKADVALNALALQTAHATAQAAVPSTFWTSVAAFGEECANKTVTEANLQEKLTTMGNAIRNLTKE